MARHLHLRPRTLRILHAVDTGELSHADAEQLLGFLALHGEGARRAADEDRLPSRSTWFRRCRQLRALGLPVPPTPAVLR